MAYIFIFIVCLLIYYPTFKYGPVVDDISNRSRRKKGSWKDTKNILFQIRVRLNGEYPVKSILLDHLITFSLHTSVCFFIYKIFNNLPAALLFSVNLSNNQVSIWMNGKRYAINALLCLTALLFQPYGIIFWFLTPFFQASAISFPTVLSLYGHWYFILLIPFILFVGNKRLLRLSKVRKEQNNLKELSTWDNRKILLIFKSIWFYFIHGLFPFTPNMYIEYLMFCYLKDEDTKKAYSIDFRTVAGFILTIFIVLLYIANKDLGFGLMWWLLTIIVYCNWTTFTMFFAERYMYLPNIGLMLFLAKSLSYINPYLWICVFILYSTRLITFMPMYKNLDSYMNHHMYWFPNNDNGWNGAIGIANSKKDSQHALILTEMAVRNNCWSPRILTSRAALLAAFGQIEPAFNCINEAKSLLNDKYGKILLPKIEKLEQDIKNMVKNKK